MGVQKFLLSAVDFFMSLSHVLVPFLLLISLAYDLDLVSFFVVFLLGQLQLDLLLV